MTIDYHKNSHKVLCYIVHEIEKENSTALHWPFDTVYSIKSCCFTWYFSVYKGEWKIYYVYNIKFIIVYYSFLLLHKVSQSTIQPLRISWKRYLSYLCALGIVSIERVYNPSTFYMKWAVTRLVFEKSNDTGLNCASWYFRSDPELHTTLHPPPHLALNFVGPGHVLILPKPLVMQA